MQKRARNLSGVNQARQAPQGCEQMDDGQEYGYGCVDSDAAVMPRSN